MSPKSPIKDVKAMKFLAFNFDKLALTYGGIMIGVTCSCIVPVYTSMPIQVAVL